LRFVHGPFRLPTGHQSSNSRNLQHHAFGVRKNKSSHPVDSGYDPLYESDGKILPLELILVSTSSFGEDGGMNITILKHTQGAGCKPTRGVPLLLVRVCFNIVLPVSPDRR
jgi:hypothetical protein